MKKSLIAFMLLCVPFVCTDAQDPVALMSKRSTSLSRTYLRPSVTKLYISDGSENASTAIASLQTVEDLKFDYNDVTNTVFTMSSIPADKKERAEAVKRFVERLFEREKIGNQILHDWYPTDSDGQLSLGVVMERGNYAATDNDVMVSNMSKRGLAALDDLGLTLIDRSYVVIYLVLDEKTEDTRLKYVTVIPYVYKLDYSEEFSATFYEEDNYTPQGIDQLDVPFTFITNARSGMSTIKPTEANKSYDDIMYLLRKVSDFQVKTPVTATRPIRANIGKKEGVKCDDRYAVMRMKVNRKGEEEAERIATVRATRKIIDNRSIADGTVDKEQQTVFYEVKGRKVMEGETLVQNPDLGINVTPEFSLSEASISIEYRAGRHIGIAGGFMYLKVGVPFSKKMKIMEIHARNEKGEKTLCSLISASLGFAKEFNFGGTFSLTPSVEGGMFFAPAAKGEIQGKEYIWTEKNKDDMVNLDTYKIGADLKLGYYITRNFQLYGHLGYSYYIKSEYMEDADFQPLGLGAGIKISF